MKAVMLAAFIFFSLLKGAANVKIARNGRKALAIDEPERETHTSQVEPNGMNAALWDPSPSLVEPVSGQVVRRS
jgi:hypothetical protein